MQTVGHDLESSCSKEEGYTCTVMLRSVIVREHLGVLFISLVKTLKDDIYSIRLKI